MAEAPLSADVPPAPSRGSSAFEVCLKALERIETVVEQETAALRGRQQIDLTEISRRKSHALLELTRGLRGIDVVAVRAELEPRLKPLRAKLEENNAVLRHHMNAVQAVSTVLAQAIRDGESDGTYSAAIRQPGRGYYHD
jgi:flagellar biosynthesis/type III secretory pathway chaperone